MSYDAKCEVLAQEFLEDEEGPFTTAELEELAQMIQTTIEAYLKYGRNKREAAATTDADAGGILPANQRSAED